MCVNSTHFKNSDEQAVKREGGKGGGDDALSDYQDGLKTTFGDSNISPADKIRRAMRRPERLHLRLLRRIQHRQILNIDEGSLRVHRVQVQLQSGHTSVPLERNTDRRPIYDEADRRRNNRELSINQKFFGRKG